MTRIDDRASGESLHVVVVGAGAIGSALLPQLGRVDRVGRVTIIDHEEYDEGNLGSQEIVPADVGRPKARVQARRLRRVRPGLEVVPIVGNIETIPLGELRGVVLAFSCLDSRKSRQRLGERLRRLGTPWVDAGIQSGADVARVTVYGGHAEDACVECSWEQEDYDQVEVAYPCSAGEAPVFATNASPGMGALAAALQLVEAVRLLDGDIERTGHEVVLAAADHKYYDVRLVRNPQCRFDHGVFAPLEALDCSPAELSLGEALEMGRPRSGTTSALRLRAEAGPFIRGRHCVQCARWRREGRSPRLAVRSEPRACPECGGMMMATGPDRMDTLSTADIELSMLSVTLDAIGLRPGDVYTVSDRMGRSRHFILPGRW